MQHVLFALFKAPAQADAALFDIEAAGISQKECRVVIHKGQINLQDLHLSESNARKGFLFGVAAGVVAGGLMGWLISGPLHFVEIGLPGGIAFGISMGLILAILGATLYGAGLPDREIWGFANKVKQGWILITAEVEGVVTQGVIKHIFSKRGALGTSKAMI
jgi:hypothetical protein